MSMDLTVLLKESCFPDIRKQENDSESGPREGLLLL